MSKLRSPGWMLDNDGNEGRRYPDIHGVCWSYVYAPYIGRIAPRSS